MPLPLLSVVIPTHDTRELTLRCLETVLAGGDGGTEVIVVDDASGDGTAEAVAARFPRVRVLRNGRAERFTRSANRGLAEARGGLLLLLNSDTEVDPGALAALAGVFAREPELGIAGGLLRYPDGSPQWSGGGEPSLAWFFALASGLPAFLARLPLYRRARPLAPPGPRAVGWVTGAALALRREVWEAAGPLDEGFAFYAQDLDLCLRARRAGWRIEVRPELAVVHVHGATIGRDPGATRRQQHALLWSDLLRWARKHRGPRWAARAALALRAGAALRLAGRRLAWPFVTPGRREEWRRDGRALRSALAALRPPLAIPGHRV